MTDLRTMTFKLDCGHTGTPYRVSHHPIRDASSVFVKCCGKYFAGIVDAEAVLAAKSTGQPIDLRTILSERDLRTIPSGRDKLDRIDFINRQLDYLAQPLFFVKPGGAPPAPERVTAFDLLPPRLRGFPGVTNVYDAFETSQRELVRIALSAEQRAAASEEWSRQLRVKVTASARKEQHRVLCDIQEID